VPLHLVIAGELELLGSHGMAAWRYPELLGLVAVGRLRPGDLVTGSIGLDEAGSALAAMADAPPTGITVVVP
jgi:alcohol dehydrogenase